MSARHLISILSALLILVQLPACGLDVMEQQFRTDIEIPKPVGTIQPIRESITYTLDGDMDDVDSITFKDIALVMSHPVDRDLTFIASIKIYLDHDGDQILVAQGSHFPVDNANVSLQIVYGENLKPLVKENRLHVSYVLIPNRWYRNWPNSGFRILADVLFEVDVNL